MVSIDDMMEDNLIKNDYYNWISPARRQDNIQWAMFKVFS